MATAHFAYVLVCIWQWAQPHFCGLKGSGRIEVGGNCPPPAQQGNLGKSEGLQCHACSVSRAVWQDVIPCHGSGCRAIKGEPPSPFR